MKKAFFDRGKARLVPQHINARFAFTLNCEYIAINFKIYRHRFAINACQVKLNKLQYRYKLIDNNYHYQWITKKIEIKEGQCEYIIGLSLTTDRTSSW